MSSPLTRASSFSRAFSLDPKELHYEDSYLWWGNTNPKYANRVIVDLGGNGVLKSCEWLEKVVSLIERQTTILLPTHTFTKDGTSFECPLGKPFKNADGVKVIHWDQQVGVGLIKTSCRMHRLIEKIDKHVKVCGAVMQALREAVKETYQLKANSTTNAREFRGSLMKVQGCFNLLLSIAPEEIFKDGEKLPNMALQKIGYEKLDQKAFLKYVETTWEKPVRDRFVLEYNRTFKHYTRQLELSFRYLSEVIDLHNKFERLIIVADSIFLNCVDIFHSQNLCVADFMNAIKFHKFAVVQPHEAFSSPFLYFTIPGSLQEIFQQINDDNIVVEEVQTEVLTIADLQLTPTDRTSDEEEPAETFSFNESLKRNGTNLSLPEDGVEAEEVDSDKDRSVAGSVALGFEQDTKENSPPSSPAARTQKKPRSTVIHNLEQLVAAKR